MAGGECPRPAVMLISRFVAGVLPFERLSECVKRKIKNIPIWLCIVPPPQAWERYVALNYPFVHRIFSWCAKGIVI